MRVNFVFACALIAFSARGALAVTFSSDFVIPVGNGGLSTGISGNEFVGVYRDASGLNGFLYNGSTAIPVNDPLGVSSTSTLAPTYPMGVSGNNVVGRYGTSTNSYQGFLYNGSTFITLTPQATSQGSANGVDGNNVVGSYLVPINDPHVSGSINQGYLYNGSTYTPVNDPLGTMGTVPQGISGNTIVGYYADGVLATHGFIFDGSTYKTVDSPLAAPHAGTVLVAVSGNYVVGNANTHAFLYDQTTAAFTSLDYPLGAKATGVLGISGDTVLEWYFDSSSVIHPFLATIPEPSTISLLGVGLVSLAAAAIRRLRT